MTMVHKTEARDPAMDSTGKLPIIVVGNGPVGMCVAQELRRHLPTVPLRIFGEEPHEPYDRLRLSSWLAGELDPGDLAQPLKDLTMEGVDQRIGHRVVKLDPLARTVMDNSGTVWPYHKLVLATGSSAHVPDVPGVQLPGVYRFHGLDDAMALLARRASSHHTLVIGGGQLGLEAARSMQRLGTHVAVIDHADRLMPQQLDKRGSAYLQYELGRMGIAVLLGSGLARVLGGERVTGVQLRDGTVIACDTLILAAGIRPNIHLAREARLSFGRGIRVDDRMRTSNPDIYAVGDCAEHREQTYGLLAPGVEQAAVVAANIAGGGARYHGSIPSTRLKVIDTPVFSAGPMGLTASRHYGRSYSFSRAEQGIYRKVLVHRHRLVGAIGIGEWGETERLAHHIGRRGRVMPWQVVRFVRSGLLWSRS